MKNKKIVILGGKGISTNIVFHYLNFNFGIQSTIIENKESFYDFVKRRIKKLGIITVFGQILFKVFIVNILNLFSKKRIEQILNDNNLITSEIPTCKIHHVDSINSDETIRILSEINPDLIVVNGTRIISKRVLSSVSCRFINLHAGITPKYRGVHGIYWALINRDIENSGVTVHFVDSGIDTGSIITQVKVVPIKDDNFVTYPLLQLASGVKILAIAIENYFEGSILKVNGLSESNLWYHPTIWGYLYGRIVRKVK